jgi:hypothetical protein
MRFRVFSVVLGVGMLLGCSNRPDVNDIKANLTDFWGQCEGIQFSGLEKTNGMDRGEDYVMSYSYKLRLTRDPKEESARNGDSICPPLMIPILMEAGFANNRDLATMNEGDTILVNGTANFVKSEKGWVMQ